MHLNQRGIWLIIGVSVFAVTLATAYRQLNPPNVSQRYETVSIMLGDWRVSVSAKRSVPRRVRVTIEDGPPADLVLSLQMDGQTPKSYRLANGDSVVLELERWPEKPKLHLDLRSIESKAPGRRGSIGFNWRKRYPSLAK